jgi:hypothetical protein
MVLAWHGSEGLLGMVNSKVIFNPASIQPVGIINALLGMRQTSYTFHLDSKEEWDPPFQIAVLSNCVTT